MKTMLILGLKVDGKTISGAVYAFPGHDQAVLRISHGGIDEHLWALIPQ